MLQKERTQTGREHYQAYVEFEQRKRLAGVLRILPDTHFEQRKKSQYEAIMYCKKDDTRIEGPWEFGVPTVGEQGRRTDIINAANYLQTHTLVDTACEFPEVYIKYHRGLANLKAAMQQKFIWDNPVREQPNIILLKGPPGAGKTRYIEENIRIPDPRNFYRKPVDDNNWFDGYEMQTNVLIDEFEGAVNKYPLNLLLQILDRYDVTVPVKGGFVHFRPKNIYLTCNAHPQNWYDFTTRYDKYKALARRFTKVIEFTEGQPEPRVYSTPEELKNFF